ncbi:MAG: efflux transporter outer membrane subunit, partial [Betaproteobacteria bacterium]|nr:efflux transporter outer membrane subunit [Betaproteobacteria bacterium]
MNDLVNFFIDKVRILTISTLACLLLSSCANLEGLNQSAATQLQLQQLALGHSIHRSNTINAPQHNWWALYHDEQLNQLLEDAIKDGQLVKSLQHRITLAKAITGIDQSQMLPSITVNGTSERDHFTALQFIPPPWAGSTYWNNNVVTGLSYHLDLWGQRKNQWQASVDEVQAVTLDGQEAVIELRNAIIKLYLELAATYQLKDLAVQELDDAKIALNIEIQRQQAGLGSKATVNDYEASLPALNNKVTALNLRIELVQTALAALIGRGPGATEKLHRPTLKLDTKISVPSSLPLHLIAQRPDITAQLWRIEAMQKRIQVAQKAFYPDINLSAFIGVEAIGFNQLFSHQALLMGSSPALSLPLFDGGYRQAQLSIANSEFDLAVDQYNQRILDALKEVTSSLSQLNSIALQQQELTIALNKREHSLLYAKESYQS